MKIPFKWTSGQLLLALIIATSLILRFYKLGFQSFWLDELHTAIEADPSMSWDGLFHYLKCCDQHPLLFFALEKLFFWVFGSTEFIARLLPAIFGTLGVWAMYLLGKKFHSVKLGLVAATITCFNYFHIWYSQEARPYILVFLLVCLSFLFLIKMIKEPSWKYSLLYAIFTVLMLYSHYFSLFVLASQGVITLFFGMLEREKQNVFFKRFLVTGIIIAACYAPWIPFLLSMAAIKTFWIEPISSGFVVDYFYGFFGNNEMLYPLLVLLLIFAAIQFLTRTKSGFLLNKNDPHQLIFVVCFLWIFITYLIPYLRSVLVVPMLHPRYAIVVLPAFLIFLSYGFLLISNRIFLYMILTVFCLLSFTDLIFVKKYYSSVHKTQFREMAQYIASDSSFFYPVYVKKTAWHQQYYLDRYNYPEEIIEAGKEAILDSVQNKGFIERLNGFWISDAHGSIKPDISFQQHIDSFYTLTKEREFQDAWAQLYISNNLKDNRATILDYRHFPSRFTLNGEKVTVIWEGKVVSNPVTLKGGNYLVKIRAMGTPVSGIYPHLNVMINRKKIGELITTQEFREHIFSYQIDHNTNAIIELRMENDAYNEKALEDRNAFIKSISFVPN